MRTARNPQWLIGFLLGAIGLGAIAVVLVLAAANDDSAGPERGDATLREVLADPQRSLGRTVTVSGEVARVDGRGRALTIGARVSPQENELIVFPPRDADVAEDLEPGAVVRATGTILRVTNPPDEADTGDPLFDDEEDDALDEFEGELGLRARRVEVLERASGG